MAKFSKTWPFKDSMLNNGVASTQCVFPMGKLHVAIASCDEIGYKLTKITFKSYIMFSWFYGACREIHFWRFSQSQVLWCIGALFLANPPRTIHSNDNVESIAFFGWAAIRRLMSQAFCFPDVVYFLAIGLRRPPLLHRKQLEATVVPSSKFKPLCIRLCTNIVHHAGASERNLQT